MSSKYPLPLKLSISAWPEKKSLFSISGEIENDKKCNCLVTGFKSYKQKGKGSDFFSGPSTRGGGLATKKKTFFEALKKPPPP